MSDEGDMALRAKKTTPSAEPASPKAWIKQIRELLAHGDEQAAREQLRRFGLRYPDYVLPEDLRKWMNLQ